MEEPHRGPSEELSKYLLETRREALTVLVPEPSEIAARIPLVTVLRGQHPDLYDLYMALVEWEGWISLEEGRPVDWSRLDIGDFIKQHAPSIGGRRSEQIVRIAQAGQHLERGGFWNWIVGKFRR